MENQEIWKDIEGYEGLYKVSDLGKIKSITLRGKSREKILHQNNNNDGYLIVNLYRRNIKAKTKKIHRLVAIAFILNPENKPTVNHKKGIKTDNRASQLEWATYSENHLHSFRELGRMASTPMLGKTGYLCPTSKEVSQYGLNGEIIDIYGSVMEAVRITGINEGNINSVCNGRRKTAGGCIWKYN